MEILLYNYEGAFLKHLNKCFPNIKLATYASDEDLLLALSDIKLFPAFFYSRQESDWSNNKILSIREGTEVYKFCQFEQTYSGSIVVEDQREAQRIASALRFFWEENSKLSVNWPDKDTVLEVQLRLLYIKIKELRRPNDKKGACRIVEFSWKSQLFQNPSEIFGALLVEEVKLSLTEEGIVIRDSSEGIQIS